MSISGFLNKIFPKYRWKVQTTEKTVFLTFDDGPVPEITEFVLSELSKYGAKATFFCVGENIRKYPEIFLKITSQGHQVGNHTFNHLNGWKISENEYLQNVDLCQKEIEKYTQSRLFRPPYGRIKKRQAQEILKDKDVIMWSVLTRDYDQSFDEEKCLKKAIKSTEKGAIVLFHDSAKAWKNMSYVLPKYLKYFSEKGYNFEPLE